MINQLFLSLGGNLGNTREIFEGAYPLIEKKIGKISVYSSIYQTEAWGPIPQADFLNQVLLISTKLSAQACLTEMLAIEKEFGLPIKFTGQGEQITDLAAFDPEQYLDSLFE